MKYFLFFFCFASLLACRQEHGYSHFIGDVIVQMAKFNGDLNKYLCDSLRYPEAEKKAGISGTVYVSFNIEKDGTVDNVKIIRGITNAPNLDKEAIRLISAMPKWAPAIGQNGLPVGVQYNLPVHFDLN